MAHQEAVALKRQEELIREEEAAGLAEIELKAKRNAAEKEKRAKKKQVRFIFWGKHVMPILLIILFFCFLFWHVSFILYVKLVIALFLVLTVLFSLFFECTMISYLASFLYLLRSFIMFCISLGETEEK